MATLPSHDSSPVVNIRIRFYALLLLSVMISGFGRIGRMIAANL